MSYRLVIISILALCAQAAPASAGAYVDVAQDRESLELNGAAYNQAVSISQAFKSAAQKALPATVKILVKRSANEVAAAKSKLPFAELLPDLPDKDLVEGGGSGFIVDPSGVVVTNSHVVDQDAFGKTISVELNDGRRFNATKVVKDEKADVAVVLISSPEPLPYLTFANSDEVEIGDWALAIGNPFMLGSSVSAGVVSAKERFVDKDSKLFIQTDAAVNPGNSGGPLVNLRGEVVGVNTAIASLSGGYQGIGFAIPSNIASWAYKQLYEKGSIERAFLGAPVKALAYEEARQLNLAPMTGVKIGAPYKDSPAAKAGLRSNDVLLAVDGRTIESPELFESLVERADVSRDFTLKILRNNASEPIEVTIRFEILPPNYVGVPVTEKMVDKGAHYVDKDWGMMVIPATPEAATRLGATNKEGLIVLNATPGGAAYRAGIRSGSFILKMNGTEVKTVEDYTRIKSETSEVQIEYFSRNEVHTASLSTHKSN